MVTEFGFNRENGEAKAFDFDIETPMRSPTTSSSNIESNNRTDTVGNLLISSNGGTTWLELFIGAVGATYQPGTPPHCYMSGVEL